MNALEIRRALEPLANFAPAILKAAEIAEAAEKAEKTLADLDGKIAQKQKTLDELDEQRKIADSELRSKRGEFEREKKSMLDNFAETKRDLLALVQPLQAKVTAMTDEFEATKKKTEEGAALLNAEIAALEGKRDALKADLQALIAKAS